MPRNESGAARHELPRVTIVIPVFNKLEYTRPCLESLLRHTPAGLAEIVVVDNGSTDGTAEYLRSVAAEVRTVVNPENLGFARACNLGAAAARAPYVLFLNNDTEAHEHWLEPLLAVLDEDPEVVGVGSKLLFPDGTLQHAGVMLVDDRRLPDPLVARHLHHGAPAELPDANVPRRFQVLTAACFMVRRTAFDGVGGFDEGFWNGYEDVDLCLKLGEAGGVLVYEPASVLTHYESKSGPQRFTKVAENIERLHSRWLGRVQPDGILDAQGRFTWTEAAGIRDRGKPRFARPCPAGREAGLTSIVILTFNQLEYTKRCVASLLRCTPEPFEVVFVDNGSSDGTPEWLHAQAAEHPAFRVIENASNQGFARGCNQGLAVARGEYALLLNNDVVLTDGWLAGLREALDGTPDAGFVGPVTNEISGRQRVERVDYADLDQLPAFAASWRQRHAHQRVFTPRVVGFCMLAHASVYERIGVLDEAFGTGNYEDDDLCLRAELAGYRNVIAASVFVHHYGSRSFVGNGLDHAAHMTRNRARFASKWRRAHETDPLSRRVLLLDALEKAHELGQTGRLRDAVELCLEAIRVSPAETTPYLALACMLVRAGHFQDALDVLQNIPSGFADARARMIAARARLGLGHDPLAAQLMRSTRDEPVVRARALDLQGLLAHQSGDEESASACFNAALAADRGYGEPYANLGAMLWARDPGMAAFELLERGFTLSPESPDALEFYCAAAKALDLAARAAGVVREARGLFPVHRGLTFGLIDLLLAAGDPAAAMVEIENAMEWFEVEPGMVRAALAVRAQVGARTIAPGAAHTLSLCMIVKNESERIVRCLRSVRGLADEMIVVDTGSSDGTPDLARALGAQVFEIAWPGSFAAARNTALEHAQGRWILVLDADEVLSACDHDRLRQRVAADAPGGAAGYILTTRNYTNEPSTAGFVANDGAYAYDERGRGWYPSRKVRLFRNDPRIRFEGALHEVVDDALRRHGLKVRSLEVPVHHEGPLAAEREREKAAGYYQLAQAKLAAAPGDHGALFELAVQAAVVGRHDEAAELWLRYVKLGSPPRLALAWMNLGHCHLETHQYELAARASREALTLDAGCREAAYNLALAELCRGRFAATIAECEKQLARTPEDAPVLGLLAAAATLAKDAARVTRASAKLDDLGEKAPAFLQAAASRLRRAGRGGDVRRLTDAAREMWRATLLARGLEASDEQLDLLLEQGAASAPAERSAA